MEGYGRTQDEHKPRPMDANPTHTTKKKKKKKEKKRRWT